MSSTNARQQTVPSPTDIEQLIAMRETQQSLKDRLKLMDEAVGSLEDRLFHAVESGFDFTRFGYSLCVQTTERRYPAWKEHFISRLGKVEADSVLEATQAVIYRKLVIK